MSESTSQATWQKHLSIELPIITDIVSKRGYSLDTDQPHLKGERFLMQAMTTNNGQKFILLGRTDDTPVVIKVTRDKTGKDELQHERVCRQMLHQIDFAYDTFHSPTEVDFFTEDDHLFSIQAFIPQTSPFLSRPLLEQFDLSLQAFLIQERARATTSRHFYHIARLFGNRTSKDYLKLFSSFVQSLENSNASPHTITRVLQAKKELTESQNRIEQYCGFLTHTDFVPHNFRVNNGTLYLLDFSSLRFGNKHESWARFLNFMTLYNPTLETALIQYIGNNRSPEELESLHLMRIFKLGEIISYYMKASQNSIGELQSLNTTRINFWSDVLAAELANTRVSRDIVATYQTTRDTLRSKEEKERQINLH